MRTAGSHAADVGRRDRQRPGMRRRLGKPATVPTTIATSGRCSGAGNNGYQHCDRLRYVSPSPRTYLFRIGLQRLVGPGRPVSYRQRQARRRTSRGFRPTKRRSHHSSQPPRIAKGERMRRYANIGNFTARRSDTRASPLSRGGPLSRVCREGRLVRSPGAAEEMTIETF